MSGAEPPGELTDSGAPAPRVPPSLDALGAQSFAFHNITLHHSKSADDLLAAQEMSFMLDGPDRVAAEGGLDAQLTSLECSLRSPLPRLP